MTADEKRGNTPTCENLIVCGDIFFNEVADRSADKDKADMICLLLNVSML